MSAGGDGVRAHSGLDREAWQLLLELLELPPEERLEELRQRAAGNAPRQALLRRLLDEEADPEGFLEGPCIGAGIPGGARPQAPGSRIGGYRVVELLGRGGTSDVYLVLDGAGRRRALKVLRLGLADPQARRRFQVEGRLLARLDHPAIARFWDAGETSAGRAFLVMEYVEGVTLDRYCARHRLSTDQRLALFGEVCEGVRHAHGHLIIHRDLKPGNILVDSSGAPKLIDFGIGKLLEPLDASPAARTWTWMRLLTPRYASPEQARGEPLTTATDIFSLGVVLYELLTGRPPFDFETGLPEEVARVIAQRPVTPPSRLARDPGASRWMPWRRGRPGTDLDAIVTKAMRFEPGKRYRSVGRFLEDLRRYRRGYPVQAREGAWSYRCGKFLRRHRLAATLTMAALTLLATVAAMAWRQHRWQEAEHRQAELLNESFFELFDVSPLPEKDRSRVTVLELLDHGVARLEAGQGLDPQRRIAALQGLAEAYQAWGAYDRVPPLRRRLVELVRAGPGTDARSLAVALERLASTLADNRRVLQAETAIRQSLEVWRRIGEDRSTDWARALITRARVDCWRQRCEAAVEHSERSLQLFTDLEGPAATESLTAANLHAMILNQIGRTEEARQLFEETIARLRARPVAPRALATALAHLGMLELRASAQSPRAGLYLEEAYELQREQLGDGHPATLETDSKIIWRLVRLGRLEEAEARARENLRRQAATLGDDHADLVPVEFRLARILADRGALDEAAERFRKITGHLEEHHPWRPSVLFRLAEVRLDQGEAEEAEGLFRDVLAIEAMDHGSRESLCSRLGLAASLVEQERPEEGLAELRRIEETLSPQAAEADPTFRWALRSELGRALVEVGRGEEGRELLAQSLERLEEGLPEHRWRYRRALHNLEEVSPPT